MIREMLHAHGGDRWKRQDRPACTCACHGPAPRAARPPPVYDDGQDFDAIFRQLVVCYNAVTEIERAIAIDMACQRNAPPPRVRQVGLSVSRA